MLSAQGNTGGEVTAATFLEGNLKALVAESGEVTGTSILTGDLSSVVSVQGSVAGSTQLTGVLASLVSVAGAVTGTSTTTGDLAALGFVSGAAKAFSTLTGRLDGDTSLQGASVAASVASGSLSAFFFAQGATEASSALTGALASLQSMVGGSTATTALGAVTSTNAFAQGSVRGSSKLTGRLDGDFGLEGQIKPTSKVTGVLSAIGNVDGEVTGVSALQGTLESCCCGDCIRFRYVLSGVANNNCTNCAQFNTTIDSPDVTPDESCVYDAIWESADCGGQKIVFKAQLFCDDGGDIRLSGQIQDTAIVGPLLDPPGSPGGPGNGPTPTNDVMSGTDTFVIGTPCDYLEIGLTRDTGSQTTCGFDSATVSLSVIDCPESQAVIEKLKIAARKKKLAKKKKASLPVVCKHLGDAMGIADCGCSGKPMIYHCNLLNQPCMKKSVSKPVSRVGGKRISRPQVCSLCDHFET